MWRREPRSGVPGGPRRGGLFVFKFLSNHAPYRWRDGLKVAVGVGGKIMDGLGLGWIISLAKGRRPLIPAKSGGIAGFMTYVVLTPTRGVGVFVAANRLNFAVFEGLTSGVRDLVADLAPR
jgi:D-alanyl-D-alanine-carboxypeptidase/D-alanyl-D-alanine-endopeptidase